MPETVPFETNKSTFSESKSKECISNSSDSKFKDIITREEAKIFVKKSISTDAELVDYHLRPYSEEKLGFLGSYFSLSVVAQRPSHDEKETRRYFVKTMPFDVQTQFEFMQEKGYFDKEVGFFRSLEPLLMDSFRGESWSSKCYLAKENVLVFEDLNTKGFSNGPRLLDEQSVRSSIASIARMHSASLLSEERNNGKSLAILFPNILKESEFDRTNKRGYTLFTVAMDLAVNIANNLGLDSTNLRRAGERVFDLSIPSRTKRNVVSHGDLCSRNVMFDKNHHCKLIDFQLIRYSPLSQDVILFLYLCTWREFRQQHGRKLIEYYHQVLTETLRNNRFKGEVPTFDEVLQSAEEQKLPALVVAVMYHPAQLMTGKAANALDDSQNYENYYFKDRKPFVFKHMAENEEYAKKLEETVAELVEMSMIMDDLPRLISAFEVAGVTASFADMTSARNEKQLNLRDDDISKIVTEQDINIVAQRFANDKSVKVLNYCFDDYSSGRLGFLGSHRNLKITFQRSNEKDSKTASFFIKSMPYSNKEQVDFMKKERIFIKEANFFKIIPQLMDESDIERWFPLCYLAKEDAIVLEDLRSDGYKMHENLLDNEVAIKSVLATLARFHSCSILTESRLNNQSNKQMRLSERYPNHFAEKVFQPTGYGHRWLLVGANLAGGIAERLGYVPTKVHSAYKKSFDLVKPSENHCNVICHGDLWGNNLMFAESSPLLKCIFVDFQITRYAPLVTDLLQFLHLNATRAFREKFEVDLVKFYHRILDQTIKRNNSTNTARVPSVEEILKSMDDLRMFGLMMATLYLPFALLDPKILAECTKDSESYNRFVFEDRLDVTLSYMKENEFFKNRVEEAVIELLDKSDR